MRNLAYIAILLLATLRLAAQQEVFKVSKQMNRNFTNEVKTIKLFGEKASVSIEGWNNDFTEVQIRQVSRNETKKTAESDLRFIKVLVEPQGETLVLKNYFEGNADIISSNLSVEYVLKVPPNVSLIVHNLYGKVVAQNLSNVLTVDISFGAVDVSSITGTTEIHAKYSELNGDDIKGSFNCTAEKTDIKLTGLNAPAKVVSKYGEVDLSLVSNAHAINVECQRTKITVRLPDQPFNFNLKNLYSEIVLSGQPPMKNDFYQKKVDEKIAAINVTTSYCPIIISKENKP